MKKILTIAGSPSDTSRSSAVLRLCSSILEEHSIETASLSVRDIPPEDLVYANFESEALKKAQALIEQADGIIVGTPVYKASYTGVLKALLDLMPQYAFSGKTILPIATGGTITHLLSIDYAMKPLFGVLGSTSILRGIFILDSQMEKTNDGGIILEPEIHQRLKDALVDLTSLVKF